MPAITPERLLVMNKCLFWPWVFSGMHVRKGYDREFGARPLPRTIQHVLESELSRGELHLDLQPGAAAESRADAARPEAVGS